LTIDRLTMDVFVARDSLESQRTGHLKAVDHFELLRNGEVEIAAQRHRPTENAGLLQRASVAIAPISAKAGNSETARNRAFALQKRQR
jgi:hypothetical protein